MLTREQIMAKIDEFPDDQLESLLSIIARYHEFIADEQPPLAHPLMNPGFDSLVLESAPKRLDPEQWDVFVDQIYGSTSGAPLERPSQGAYEQRLAFL